MPAWTSFEYRGFYDVPRVLVFSLADGRRILLECVFDDDLEDYLESYDVFFLSEAAQLDGSWANLATSSATRLGSIRVKDMRFDESQRAQIDLDSPRLRELIDPVG